MRRCFLILNLFVWLCVAGSAQTVKIQGQELPYRFIDGRQMVSRALLAKAFPGFPDGKGEVDLGELAKDPQARVMKREGLIVSIRYYNNAMAALYEASREPVVRPATTAADSGQTSSEGGYQTLMAEVVRFSNEERKTHGAAAVVPDKSLEKAAAGHSEEMARLNYFEHTSPTPGRETPDTRIRLAGANARKTGENLALLSPQPESVLAREVVTGWMNSPGHRANLLDPDFTHIGIGVARGPDGRYYITQNFCAY